MNLLADESVDQPIVGRLRQAGHSVLYVAEMEPGISDDVVLERAQQADALLLTADKDFGELVVRQQRVTSGILLIRLAGLSPISKAEIVTSAIQKHAEELPHAFTVVTHSAIRIRHSKLE